MKRGNTPHGCTPSQGRLIFLSSFFEEVYRPIKLRHDAQEAGHYRSAIKKLERTLGRRAQLADLNRHTLNSQRLADEKLGLRYGTVFGIRWRLNGMWRFAAILGLLPTFVGEPRRKQLEVPKGPPGTVSHFYHETFRPETLQTANHRYILYYQTTMRRLNECFGRELELNELSPAIVAEFAKWLTVRGLSPKTIKNFRDNLLVIWRYAEDQRQAPPVCRVRPIKVPREQPDAWSLRELTRIIESAGQAALPPHNGIPANDFWPALLLVGWYTGLRRRALFSIQTTDVQLGEGWIYVPACAMKHAVGKRFRIGPDAVTAIRRIWDRTRPVLFPRHPKSAIVDSQFKQLLDTAQVPPSRLRNCHFHKLRRTTATHVAAAAGLAAASALLGHSGPELLKRYIDPTYIVGNDATEFLPPVTGSPENELHRLIQRRREELEEEGGSRG